MKKLMKSLVTDEKSSWITVSVVALLVALTIIRSFSAEKEKSYEIIKNYKFIADTSVSRDKHTGQRTPQKENIG